MKIDAANSFIEYSIKEGITFEKIDAIAAKNQVISRFPTTKFYVLAEGVDFFTVTREAREHCAAKGYMDNVHCVAFYTTNATLLLLGQIFNKINKPAVTTKFFNDREMAREWLQGQMKSMESTR